MNLAKACAEIMWAEDRASRSGIYDVRVTHGDGRIIAESRGHSRTLGQKFFEDQ